MFNRIKQFFRAVTAEAPSDNEMEEIKKLVPDKALVSFLQLTIADQRHSLNVYYTARNLAGQHDKKLDDELLYRCAILHDIGRGGNMTTMKKTLSVLLDKFLHEWSVARGNEANRFLGEMLHRYYHHGEISGAMLRQAGMNREADIVELHHVPMDRLIIMAAEGNQAAGSQELKLLIMADSIN